MKSDIKKLVTEYYDIDDIKNIERINKGRSTLYIITTDSRKYILKMFPVGFNYKRIENGIKVISKLKDRFKKVPNLIRNKYDKLYSYNSVNYFLLEDYIAGYELNDNEANEEQLEQLILTLCDILKIINEPDITLPINNDYLYNNISFDEYITNLRTLLNKCDNDFVKKIINKKIEILSELDINYFKDINNVTYLNTHGDYTIFQILYSYNYSEIYAVLDYASVKKMPIVWEIIRSFIFADKDSKSEINIKNLIKYITIYNNNYQPLNYYDYKYMVYIYYIYILKSTFGFTIYNDNQSEEAKNVLETYYRQILYLEKNIKKITDILIDYFENCQNKS